MKGKNTRRLATPVGAPKIVGEIRAMPSSEA